MSSEKFIGDYMDALPKADKSELKSGNGFLLRTESGMKEMDAGNVGGTVYVAEEGSSGPELYEAYTSGKEVKLLYDNEIYELSKTIGRRFYFTHLYGTLARYFPVDTSSESITVEAVEVFDSQVEVNAIKALLNTRTVENIPAGMLAYSTTLSASSSGTIFGAIIKPTINFILTEETEVSLWISQRSNQGTAVVAIFKYVPSGEDESLGGTLKMLASSETLSLSKVGLITGKMTTIPYEDEEERTMESGGWYYAAVVTTDTNAKFLALEDSRFNNPAINVWPRLIWRVDNATSNWDPTVASKRDIATGNVQTNDSSIVKPYIRLKN